MVNSYSQTAPLQILLAPESYGYDVAKAIAKIVGNLQSLGETIHVTTSETIYWKDVLKIYLDSIEGVTGVRPKVLYLEDTTKLAAIMHNTYQIKYDRCYDRFFKQ